MTPEIRIKRDGAGYAAETSIPIACDRVLFIRTAKSYSGVISTYAMAVLRGRVRPQDWHKQICASQSREATPVTVTKLQKRAIAQSTQLVAEAEEFYVKDAAKAVESISSRVGKAPNTLYFGGDPDS